MLGKRVFKGLVKLFRDEQGISSIEYAVLGASIAVVIVATLSDLGQKLRALYQIITW